MERKKIKPARKTKKLTEKQKEAQRLRLEKMRAKKKPPEYKNVSKYVLSLDDEEPYSFKNVKEWIKHNKEMISMLQARARIRETSSKDKQHSLNMADNKKAFIRYIEHYIKTGDWIGMFSGRDEQNKVIPKCVAMAYYPDGTPKRNVGVFYPDIKAVWTKEMNELDYRGEDGTIGFGNAPVRAYNKKLQAMTDKQFQANL